MTQQAAPAKPLPAIDEDNRPFWDGAKRHKLMIPRCKSCGRFWIHFPILAAQCPKCAHSEMEWAQTSGKGKLFAFAIMEQVYHPAFKDEVPYNVSVVELDEGALLTTNIVECKNEDLKIGMPVEIVFEDITEEVTLPKFRPAS